MRKPIIIVSLCIFFFSCEKKSEKNPYLDIKISSEITQAPYDQLEYTFNLPDTVLVNKLYKATIEFKSDFDNIMPPVQVDALSDSTKVRVITFYRFEPFKHSDAPTNLV